MFLKVMHDGADEFLATADSDATYSIYADVTSCHFNRFKPDASGSFGGAQAEAHIWCREPVKTAEVPGYAEIEKHIILTGDAFLMNEQGRTISIFKLRGVHANDPKPRIADIDDAEAMRLLGRMPYAVAAAIRTTAKQAGSVSAAYLIELLDKAKVAMDA